MMSREPNYSASSSPHESQKDVEKRVGPLYYKDAAYPVHGRLCLCRAGRSTQLNSDQILCSRNGTPPPPPPVIQSVLWWWWWRAKRACLPRQTR